MNSLVKRPSQHKKSKNLKKVFHEKMLLINHSQCLISTILSTFVLNAKKNYLRDHRIVCMSSTYISASF